MMNATIKPLNKTELAKRVIHYSFADSPFAKLCMASTNEELCSVSLVMGTEMQAVEKLQKTFPGASLKASVQSDHLDFMKVFTKEPVSLHFHLLGTPFQLEVWRALLNIPYGSTTTYGTLAAQIGRSKAFRAVGSAVGDNPIFLAIPCHRVLPASGGIGNYFWGPEIKKTILDWEKS